MRAPAVGQPCAALEPNRHCAALGEPAVERHELDRAEVAAAAIAAATLQCLAELSRLSLPAELGEPPESLQRLGDVDVDPTYAR